MFFEEEVYNQYFVIAFAVAIVAIIKYVTVNKAYEKKTQSFIHPTKLLPEIKKKIKSIEDARTILALNLTKVS
jgi:hypothetical protein